MKKVKNDCENEQQERNPASSVWDAYCAHDAPAVTKRKDDYELTSRQRSSME